MVVFAFLVFIVSCGEDSTKEIGKISDTDSGEECISEEKFLEETQEAICRGVAECQGGDKAQCLEQLKQQTGSCKSYNCELADGCLNCMKTYTCEEMAAGNVCGDKCDNVCSQ